jgi:hypothetical protein
MLCDAEFDCLSDVAMKGKHDNTGTDLVISIAPPHDLVVLIQSLTQGQIWKPGEERNQRM